MKRFARELPKAIDMTGQSDLQLHLAGSANGPLDFQGTLSSQNMTLVPGPWTTGSIPVRHVTASGRWHGGDQPQISNITLQWEDSHLAGQIAWADEDQPFFIEANVANSSLEVARLMPWLPHQGEPWQALRNRLQAQGTIYLESAKFRVGRAATKHRWQIDHFRGELREAAWKEEALPLLAIASLPLQVTDNRWQIDDGQASLGAMPVRLQGQGDFSSEGFTVKALDLDGASPLERLQDEWQVPETTFVATGTVAWKAHLEGPQDNLAVDFQADLGDMTIRHTDGLGLQLSAEPEDHLTLHGKITPDLLDLEHGSITLSALKGRLAGQFRYADPASLTLDAMLSVEDLTRLAESIPVLEPLHLRGQAELRLAQRGLPQHQPPEMTLTLRDTSFRPTRYIAVLNNINGRIQVNPDGLQADNLQVHLGESPLTVTAKLDDYRNPRLSLDVQGTSVRAQDIIFPTEQTAFRNLIGHLEIDAKGLRFAPVSVHLDGGTDATIKGTIRFQPPYGVDLEITSDFARISEVIALWTKRPQDTSGSAKPTTTNGPVSKRPRPRVQIKAQVAQGDLYGMAFHDASGLIQPTRERLLIFPLDFSVGTGSCNAQVLTEFGGDSPSRIRISGHAKDIDGFAVYSELLDRQSILRGLLSGDFYLQGDLGRQFLPSSYGHFNIQIREGVLRQFHILSKVFSLLNVSQIFALELPDMDREGMPYQLLTGNLTLDKGVLKSDDLVIRSEAMNQSYIGQVDLTTKTIDLILSVQPLGTVDKIVSRIPVAGWLLTGEDRALLTAHFSVKGDVNDATVQVMPLDTLSEPTIGLLKRTFNLPMKLIKDPHILWGGQNEEPVEKPAE
ncbi:MAG: AsmA-like C-terminal domain-containing protein [Desulfuromonadales bacterium]